jgi:hypothetical protein
MDMPIAEGTACRANISGPGKRRRARFAAVLGVITLASLVGMVLGHVSWPWRLLIGLPAAAAVLSGLQVRRNTCVAHAAKGTFEHDDFSTTKVEEEFAAASRKVAATITRDALIAGVAVAVVAALIP